MKIEFKKPSLIYYYFSILVDNNVISKDKKNDVSSVIEKINEYINNIDTYKLLMNDERSIPNSVFLDLLSKIANIQLEEKDYLEILSLKYNKKYNFLNVIRTDMVLNKGNTNYVLYKVASINKLNTSHIYTTKEINELISDNSIILLDEIIDYYSKEKQSINEKHIKYDHYRSIDFSLFKDSKLYYYTLMYIRNNVTNELLKKKLDEYIKLLKEEINKVTKNKYLINNSNIISNDINEEINSRQLLLRIRDE